MKGILFSNSLNAFHSVLAIFYLSICTQLHLPCVLNKLIYFQQLKPFATCNTLIRDEGTMLQRLNFSFILNSTHSNSYNILIKTLCKRTMQLKIEQRELHCFQFMFDLNLHLTFIVVFCQRNCQFKVDRQHLSQSDQNDMEYPY